MAFRDGWSHWWPIAIHANSVITSPVSAWPCLITDVHFPAGAWAQMNADASDLRFSSDEAGLSELYYDAPRISVAGQGAHLYVQVPTLASTKATTIYAWVGNAAATAPSAAWMQNTYPADWAAFWPMEEGTGTAVGDRTANARHGMLTNMDASNWVAGINGGYALQFGGNASAEYVAIANTASFTQATMAACVRRAATADTLNVAISTQADSSRVLTHSNGAVLLGAFPITVDNVTPTGASWTNGAWETYAAAIQRGTPGLAEFYHNATRYVVGTGVSTAWTTGTLWQIGARNGGLNWSGDIDSAFILSRPITADEAAVHHAQFDPATWASAGELVEVGGGAVYRPWLITGGRMR